MRMLLTFSLAVLALFVLSLGPAQAGPSYFLSSGLTATSEFGFTGGWGVSGGLEVPIAPVASFLVRGDYHEVPSDNGPIALPLTGSLGRNDSDRASLQAAFAGLRLHPPTGTVQTYADALVGVGHIRDRSYVYSYTGPYPTLENRNDTNVALSFGGGLRFVTGRTAMFVDGHYDFYFVDVTPIIPVRMGLSYR